MPRRDLKAWREANREVERARGRHYYAADPEKYRRKTRSWRAKNPDKSTACTKAWWVRLENRAYAVARACGHRVEVPMRSIPALCNCCGKPPQGQKGLALDHDHVTGRFRGWCCAHCNGGAGIKDSIPLLKLRIAYLERAAALQTNSPHWAYPTKQRVHRGDHSRD